MSCAAGRSSPIRAWRSTRRTSRACTSVLRCRTTRLSRRTSISTPRPPRRRSRTHAIPPLPSLSPSPPSLTPRMSLRQPARARRPATLPRPGARSGADAARTPPRAAKRRRSRVRCSRSRIRGAISRSASVRRFDSLSSGIPALPAMPLTRQITCNTICMPEMRCRSSHALRRAGSSLRGDRRLSPAPGATASDPVGRHDVCSALCPRPAVRMRSCGLIHAAPARNAALSADRIRSPCRWRNEQIA